MTTGFRVENVARRFVLFCTTLAGTLALLVAMGWLSGRWALGSLGAGLIPMAPGTAWLFVWLNGAVLLHVRWPEDQVGRRFGWATVLLTGATGAAVLASHWLGFSLPLEEWLFPVAVTVDGIPVGRMSPVSAVCFLIAAVALGLVLCVKKPGQTLRQVAARLGLVVSLIGVVVVLGYTVGAPLLYGTGQIPMALLTAVGFVLLGFALALTAKPANWLLEMMVGEAAEQPGQPPRRYGWKLIGIGLALLTCIGIGGTLNLRRSMDHTRTHAQEELAGITAVKAHQVGRWYAERLADAQLIAESTVFSRSITEYLADPSAPAARDRVRSWMQSFQENRRYSRVLLLDAQRTVRLAVPEGENWFGERADARAGEALRTGQIVVSDLHLSGVKTNYPNLDFLVPVAAAGGAPVGVVLLEVSAEKDLYPLVQSWPLLSATAETLLFRRDGDDVLYLNELRHRPGTALTLRRPVSQPGLIAGLALARRIGVAEGVDYRGVPVLGAFRPVPGTPWLMVAKIDQVEVFTPVRKQTWLMIVVVVAVAAVLYLSLSLLWQQRNTALLHRQLHLEHDRDVLSQRLTQLLKHANDIIVLSDRTGRIVEVNDRAVESYGYTAAELQRMQVVELRAPAEQAGIDQLEERLRTQGHAVVETVHQRQDGATFPVEVSVRGVEIAGVNYRLAITRDITKRKQAEGALRASEEVFRALSLSSPLGVFMTDLDGRMEYTNSRCREIFGLTLGQCVGEGWMQAIDHADNQRVLGEWYAGVRSAKPVDLEFRLRRGDGTVRWVRLRGDVRFSTATKPEGYVGTVEDITARKRAEAAVLQSEQRYRSLVDTAKDVIFVITPGGTLASLNPVFEKLTGRWVRDWVGKPFATLVHPDDLPRAGAAFQTSLTGQAVDTFELRIARAAGDYLDGEFTVTPQWAEGRVVGVLGIARDITERKRAEAALRESEQQFHDLFEHSPDAVFVESAAGVVLDANVAACRLHGLRREELVGQNVTELVPPDQRATVEREFPKWFTGELTHCEGLSYDAQHHPTPVEISGALIQYRGQSAVLLHVRDITKRRQAAEALRESEASVHAVLQSTADGILAVSADAKVLFANDRFAAMWRIPTTVFANKDDMLIRQYVLDQLIDAPSFLQRVQELYQSDQDSFDTIHFKDGRIFERLSRPLMRGPTLAGRVWSFRDITERSQAEETIKRLAAFPQSNPNPVLEFSASGEILYCNTAATALASELGCAQPAAMLPPDTTAIVAECLKTNQSRTRLELPCGRRTISWSFYPITDRGVVHCYAGDVTDRHQLEAQVRQSQKMEAVGQLAGGVAHDFNNLLNVIIGYGEMVLAKLDPASPYYGQVSQMKKAGDRAAGLTRQLLAFSRKQIIEPKVLDLNVVVGDLHKMLRRLVREDIDIVLALAPALGRVKVDPTQIEQVITNMVVNARDAMPHGGKLTITTSNATLDDAYVQAHPDVTPGEYVQLAIRDSGIGMTDEVKARLFEPFFTTKGVGQGTGLGLATCYGAVKQSGGHITVESAVGQGTTFNIYLPRVADRLVRVDGDETMGSLPVGHETILLVEDDDAVREMAEMMLTELGYQVLVASNGEAALHAATAKAGAIHLLLTDVVMPKMNGKQLADELRKLYPKIKVLFVSGYTADAIVSDGVLEPGVAFLQKPYFSFALACKVREVLDT
jgi:PAS domain S-box-containing protein